MDFSVNNKVKKTNNVNFQGLKGALSKKGNQVFQFIPPKFNTKEEKMFLQLAFLKKDSATGQYAKPDESSFLTQEFEGDNFIELLQEKMQNVAQEGAFAYRYKIVKNNNENDVRYVTDQARTITTNQGGLMNVIDMGKSYGVTPKGGAMRHSFLDSDGVLKGGELFEDKDFVRNHFNKLGGSIEGLNYLLENTNVFEPYRYIISTPDIGVDPISSHKYWPCNQYQCSDFDAFKKFNFNLFKKGKGYVADGAFTSQGIQSPMVHHVLKWGEDSPFYNMLKVNGKIKLGVLPDRGAANPSGKYGHLGVKIVNSPKQKNYNSKQPTYMQFFDDRLSSPSQREENALIRAYDSKPKDHYDIVNHQDSVQPYYFELDLSADADKIAKFGANRTIMLDDIKDDLGDFLTFSNFSIDTKQNAAGATYWDGNRDIIKMNLSNPSYKPENKQGLKDAREYLYGVASFWSEAIQSELLLETARAGDTDKKAIAAANDISKDFIDDIFKNSDSLTGKTYMVLKQNKTAKDYVEEFPLQSIETSPELSAIFAQPQFKKEFLTENTKKQLTDLVETTIKNAIPEKYKNNSEYMTYVTKTYANSILKYILSGAMDSTAVKGGVVDVDKLRKNVTLKSMQPYAPSTVEVERKQVISKIKSGIKPDLISDMSKEMKENLKEISLEDFKRAEIIVEQGKGGLNWRFDAAKDIGDLDAVRAGDARFSDIWDGNDMEGVVEFWSKFIGNVHKYNPSSYIISEITDLWKFWDEEDREYSKFFDDKLDKYLRTIFDGTNATRAPYIKEMQFLEKTNSTTSSNYCNYFNNLMNFIGVNPESGKRDDLEGNLEELKKEVDLLIDNAPPNAIMLSHMFTDNHDKPRLLHVMPLGDKVETYLRKVNGKEEKTMRGCNLDNDSLTGGGVAPEKISSKSYAVGLMMKEAIEAKYGKGSNKSNKLIASLRNFVLGKRDNDDKSIDFRRQEAFATLPYEVTIRDVFNKAGFPKENDEPEIKKEIEDEIEQLTWDIIEDSAWKEEKMIQVMNAMPGVPTLYNGTEYAQTGFETPNKNVFVGNRGQIRHKSIEGNSYAAKKRGEFYNKVSADMSMSQLPGLSALRDGSTVSLNIDSNVWPIYKYDEKGSRVISIIDPNAKAFSENPKKAINLKTKNGACPIEEGTEFTRLIYDAKQGKYVDDKSVNSTYVVNKEGQLVNKENGQQVVLNDTVTTFYAKNPAYNKPSFMGSLYNQTK